MATPVTVPDLQAGLLAAGRLLAERTAILLERQRQRLGDFQDRLRYCSPERRLQSERQHLDEWSRRVETAQSHRLGLAAERLRGAEQRLQALSPLGVLQRGYAMVTRKADGALIQGISQVAPGDGLSVRVRDGEFEARVSGEK
jgi:exodeoxyribonuclease VII large subunit